MTDRASEQRVGGGMTDRASEQRAEGGMTDRASEQRAEGGMTDRASEQRAGGGMTKRFQEQELIGFASFESLRHIRDISAVMPVVMDFCGQEKCAPGYGYGPAIRSVFIIHVITDGRGKLVKNGRTFSIEKGDAFIIYPGEENYYQADMREPWTYMWIGFHGLYAEAMMENTDFSRECPVIACPDPDKICAHMETMLRFNALTYVNELIRMRELYSILVVLSREPGENGAEKGRGDERDSDHGYVQTAVNLLISSFGKQIRVSDVARAVGISRNYLDEIFKKEMGVSPKEFLMNYRMEKASSLLASTSSPVGLIAEEVGYSDPMTFSKVFRRRRGMSPTEFRERHRTETGNVKKVRLSI